MKISFIDKTLNILNKTDNSYKKEKKTHTGKIQIKCNIKILDKTQIKEQKHENKIK